MKIRKTKKLLKSYKKHVEIALGEYGDCTYSQILFPNEELQFTKFGVTRLWQGVPYEHIPFRRMGRVRSIDLSHLDK